MLDSASTMKEYQDAIEDMYKQMAQAELDALFDLIDARNKALSRKKAYYDYDKSHPKYNYLYTGIDTIVASLVEEFKPFKIIKKNLAGHIYNVPENIEEWLLQEYGKDWNKHISVWDSLINDPNITEESKLAVFYFGSIRMHEAFRQKKYAKALNYYTQLKNRWQYPFTPQMCEIIETCLEKIKPQSKIE